MTIRQPLRPLSQQATHVTFAQARRNSLGVCPCRMTRSCFNRAQMAVVRRKDVHHALTVVTVVDRRYNQAISEYFALVRHPRPRLSEHWNRASLNRAGYVPKAGGTQEARATDYDPLTVSLQRARPFEALAFNEIKGKLMRRLQRTGLRLKDDTSDVAPGAIFDHDLLHAHAAVAGDGTHSVTTALKAEPLLAAPSCLLLAHLQGFAWLTALILQGNDHADQPSQLGGEKATLATVKPPRNRRTRLRPDTDHKDCSHG